MATVDNLSITISTNAGIAAKKLNALSDAVNNLNSACGESNSIKEFNDNVRKMGEGNSEIEQTSNSVRKLGRSASQSQGTISKLFRSIGRIAFYRAIRTAVKEVGQAFSEGADRYKQYSEMIDGTFYQSMTKVNVAFEQAKNQLGAMVGEIYNNVAPLLEKLSQILLTVADKVTQFFSALAGKTTYSRAKTLTEEMANNLADSDKSAKSLKNTLLGFDEINRLNDNSSSSSNSFSNWGALYEEVELESWAKKVKEVADWIAEVGENMGLDRWESLALTGAIAGLIACLPSLIKLFLGKNKALETQTGDTQAETSAVKNLLGKFALGVVIVGLFGKAISKIPSLDTKESQEAVGELAYSFEEASEKIKADAKDLSSNVIAQAVTTFASIMTGASALQTSIGSIKLAIDTSGIVTSFSNAFNTVWTMAKTLVDNLQTALSNIDYSSAKGMSYGLDTALSDNPFVRDPAKDAGEKTIIGYKPSGAPIYAPATSETDTTKSATDTLIDASVLATSGIVVAVEKVKEWLDSLPSISTDSTGIGEGIGGLGMLGSFFKMMLAPLGYATGGFPEDGLFFANHNELVGQFSNGRTAVANNAQIVDGISQGVYDAMMSAGSGRDGNTYVYLDGKLIAEQVSRRQWQTQRAMGV